ELLRRPPRLPVGRTPLPPSHRSRRGPNPAWFFLPQPYGNAPPAATASAIEPQSADRRQFQRRYSGVDADIEPQNVEFEPFVNGEQDAGEPEERELETGPAGCRSKHRTPGQKVFADRVGRQIEAEIGNLSGNKRGEGIAVGAGPGTVLMRIRIAGDR